MARIRRLAREAPAAAAAELAALLRDRFDIEAEEIRPTLDAYALNSLSGTFRARGRDWFFKFHQEEGEESGPGEYYRARLLADAGLPVDLPAFASTEPGEQLLVYPRRTWPRFADLLRRLDLDSDTAAMAHALALEAGLCERLLAVYRRTLHPIGPEQAAAEPVHRLFHARLTDPMPDGSRRYPGGRLASFYLGREVELPGARLAFEDLARRRWRIDGREHRDSLADLFDRAAERLAPERLADAGGVSAHGDAHAANLWIDPERGLVLFDPAFAGAHLPTLLAEIKPTFHNTLAHPFWLYEPFEAAARFRVEIRLAPGAIEFVTDWRPSPIRRALLRVKALRLWRPLLGLLAERGLLPPDWRETVRLALFLCPTLVMSLRAGPERPPVASAIGFAVAVAAGSPAEDGADLVSRFLDAIDPALDGAAAAHIWPEEVP
ncbi:MAG: hypothetical protein NZ555_14210 [Geminicoccaceae bacterium]|nr:hypothetical protein [Geminicoccaceae bacterium]MDW8370797.1 hypothetical protein [Geminicoccaceae bacterium]